MPTVASNALVASNINPKFCQVTMFIYKHSALGMQFLLLYRGVFGDYSCFLFSAPVGIAKCLFDIMIKYFDKVLLECTHAVT